MSVQVKHRGDTATNLAAFTPAQREIVVDTTNNRMIVGDGSTSGGWPAAKLSEIPSLIVQNSYGGSLNVYYRDNCRGVHCGWVDCYTDGRQRCGSASRRSPKYQNKLASYGRNVGHGCANFTAHRELYCYKLLQPTSHGAGACQQYNRRVYYANLDSQAPFVGSRRVGWNHRHRCKRG